MAQKFFNVWKDPVESFPLSEQQNGPLPKGRYCGYDSILDTGAPGPGVTVQVTHGITGYDKTIESGSLQNNVGIAKLPNGTIVHEDNALASVVVPSNAANAFDRIDLLVADHTYTPLPGGTPVTYAVIQGANGGPVEPSVPTPASQVIIGRFYVLASSDAFGSITYTPADVPLVGEETYASFRAKLDLQTTAVAAAQHAGLQTQIDDVVNDVAAINSVPQGLISMWSGTLGTIPSGWNLCDGTNGTPNLSGRFIVGYQNSDPDYGTIGNTGGEKEHTLTIDEMPTHSHTLNTPIQTPDTDRGVGNSSQWSIDVVGNYATNEQGGDQPHENRPPYFVLAYIIKL